MPVFGTFWLAINRKTETLHTLSTLVLELVIQLLIPPMLAWEEFISKVPLALHCKDFSNFIADPNYCKHIPLLGEFSHKPTAGLAHPAVQVVDNISTTVLPVEWYLGAFVHMLMGKIN